ncbi:9202_t:CDS:2 [Funneliformis geosporum]|uniref:9202_t:CDS:1 n=1 Tax=Funneliformis geosporum TaxID=1117311 RepID=A0A9W4SE09_9GLOM|nr:9202_t:CDS:2 [Funneliformis geosporum]
MAERIGIDLEKLNNKLKNLLEENNRLKQQHKDFQKENRETLRINSELKNKLQEKDDQLEKLQQKVQNLEAQKNEFEMLSQTLEKTLEMLEWSNSYNKDEILVVVGFDFGTTYSGFAYCHISKPQEIYAHDQWPESLVKKQMQRNGNYKRPVELFKLCLCQPHPLPPLLDYKKAITDYFREIGKEMKKTIATWYPGIDFLKNVLLVLTKFHEGKTALRSEMLCGSTFVDKEFIEYLSRKLGNSAMEMFRENHYEQMQFLIQEFCKSCKWPFTGEKQDFSSYELDLDVSAPMLKKYITNDMIEKIEEDEWIIEIGFNDIKSMFDPVVEKILNLIHKQLNSSLETCSAMFLIGGFSESKYLQRRIKENFAHRVHTILVPGSPIVTIELGAVIYDEKRSKKYDGYGNLIEAVDADLAKQSMCQKN